MPVVLVVVAAAVVLAVVVGGLLSVGRSSGGYRRAVNRSYAAQAKAVVAQSNATGAELRRLMSSMTTRRRQPLHRQLASLEAASSQEAASAAALSPPTPTVGGFSQAMALRARGVAMAAAAVEGVLGLAGGSGRATVPVGRASSEVAGAGTLLLRADRDYAAVRRAFLAAPGSARLPRSVWVTDPSGWSPGPVHDLVQALTLTPGLAGAPDVVVRAGTVHVVPTVVPPVQPGDPPVALPTHHLQVAAVVADQGSLGVPAVTATAAVAPQGPGRADRTTVTVSVPAGGSVAVTFPLLSVTPGDTYTLSVTVTPPAGQADRSGTRASYTLRIALPTPPTTTTTTSTTRPGRS